MPLWPFGRKSKHHANQPNGILAPAAPPSVPAGCSSSLTSSPASATIATPSTTTTTTAPTTHDGSHSRLGLSRQSYPLSLSTTTTTADANKAGTQRRRSTQHPFSASSPPRTPRPAATAALSSSASGSLRDPRRVTPDHQISATSPRDHHHHHQHHQHQPQQQQQQHQGSSSSSSSIGRAKRSSLSASGSPRDWPSPSLPRALSRKLSKAYARAPTPLSSSSGTAATATSTTTTGTTTASRPFPKTTPFPTANTVSDLHDHYDSHYRHQDYKTDDDGDRRAGTGMPASRMSKHDSPHRQHLSERSGLNRSNLLVSNERNGKPTAATVLTKSNKHKSSASAITSAHPDAPSLQAKRSTHDAGLIRRRSSKKTKADQYAREQEVRAMSAPISIPNGTPKRPRSEQADLLARDTIPAASGWHRKSQRPVSNVSLPQPDSMRSQMSVASDQHAFKISALDALSPRPTIKYASSPYSSSPAMGSSPFASRMSTQKHKEPMIIEESGTRKSRRRRINELADDMDAGSLRELMDRDRRRSDKQRKADHETLQKRLERRAASQAQAATGVQDRPPTRRAVSNTRSVASRGLASSSRDGARTPESWLKDPSHEHLPLDDNPFHDSVIGISTSHLEEPSPVDDREDPILETAQVIRLSSASMSPPIIPPSPPSSPPLLQQPIYRPPLPQEPLNESFTSSSAGGVRTTVFADPSARRGSEKGRTRSASGWKSLFRRNDSRTKGDVKERGRITPSEFSNTSRESVTRSPLVRPVSSNRLPHARSSTLIRSQSIFKEDLPQTPLSPPDSRIQSPELIGAPSSRLPDLTESAQGDDDASLTNIHPALRDDAVLSRHASLRARSPEEPRSAGVSESLASVDAEGSWLTGRPVKRASTPQPLRDTSAAQSADGAEDDESDQEPGTPPAEKYIGSLMPLSSKKVGSAPNGRDIHQNEGNTLNQGDDEEDDDIFDSGGHVNAAAHSSPLAPGLGHDEGTTWHSAVGRQPTIVRQGPGPRAKSREGLLTDFRTVTQTTDQKTDPSPTKDDDSPTTTSASDNSPTLGHVPNSASTDGADADAEAHRAAAASIQRATSVDLNTRHARHISAGSARLLNLPPRSSQEIKRLSSGSAYSGVSSTGSLGAAADGQKRPATRSTSTLLEGQIPAPGNAQVQEEDEKKK